MIIHNLPIKEDEMLMKAFCPDIEQWVTGNVIYFGPDEYRISGIDSKTGVINTYKFIWETMTNYTGHKDRNGQMMFTGDIINIDYIPEKKYIYACANGIAEIAPVGYVMKGQDFAETEKIKFDLNKPAITSHMEITGTVLQNIIPGLMDSWRTRTGMDMPDEDISYDDGDIYDFSEDEDLSPEDWLDEDVVEIELGDDEDDGFDEDGVVPISDMVDKNVKYRALSIDTTLWVFGNPVFGNDSDNPDKQTCSILDMSDDEITVTPVIPHTVGRISDISDKHGHILCAGDIVILDGVSASVFMYMRDDSEFGVIPYNMYNTEYSEIRTNWKVIIHDVWKNNPANIEIVGNIYTGFTDEFNEHLEEHLENISGLDMTSIHTELDEVDDVDPVKKSIIYDTASKIDSVIHSVKPDIRGWYTYDFNSTGDECIIMGRWTLPGGYEMRMTLNAKTMENSVHFGKYGICKDEWKRHGIISHSHNDYSDMIDSIVNVLVTTDPYKSIENLAIKYNPNQNSNEFRMKKGLSYDNILDKKFSGAETISQKDWSDIMKSCFSRKTIEKIESRALDTICTWCHGIWVEDDNGNEYIRTTNIESPLKRAGTVISEYMKASFSMNTYMIDRYGKFIYSSDIVEYDGIGKVVVLASAETDPNDPVRSVMNDDGNTYLYWMRLDTLNGIINDTDKHFDWSMINPAEWIRNRDKITIIGNMIDYFVEQPEVVLNSNDFKHDDNMALVFDMNEICSVSSKDNENYWTRQNKNEKNMQKDLDRFFHDVDDEGIFLESKDREDWPLSYRVMELSDGTPVAQVEFYSYEDEDASITAYVLPDNKASIIVAKDGFFDGNPVMFFKNEKYHIIAKNIFRMVNDFDVAEYVGEILAFTDGYQIIDEDTAYVTPYQELYDEMSGDSEKFKTRKDFIENLKKNMKPEDWNKYMCRALNRFGEVMIGRLDPNNQKYFINSLTGKKELYIKESLCFNTWFIDANGNYIFDNDNIMFGGTEQQIMFNMIHKRRLTMDDKESCLNEQCNWKKYCDIISQEDDISRSVSEVLMDRWSEESLDDVQWVPVDTQWMLRNMYRLMVLGNFTERVP